MFERKPQKADSWFENHQATCGGTFIKISEPSKKKEKQPERKEREGKRKMENDQIENNMTLDKWIDKGQDEKSSANKKVRILDFNKPSTMSHDNKFNEIPKEINQGNDINTSIQILDDDTEKSYELITSGNEASSFKVLSTVQCPICGNNSIKSDEINEHIDLCIWMTEQTKNEK